MEERIGLTFCTISNRIRLASGQTVKPHTLKINSNFSATRVCRRGSMPIPATKRHGDLVEVLKQFLNAQSAAPAEVLNCSKCGSVLDYLPTQFWLEGTEQGWNIRLPYCPDCQPLSATRRTFVA